MARSHYPQLLFHIFSFSTRCSFGCDTCLNQQQNQLAACKQEQREMDLRNHMLSAATWDFIEKPLLISEFKIPRFAKLDKLGSLVQGLHDFGIDTEI